ncbi:BatA domain-containing protein [Pedobacter sp. MC2016-24]|uniref:BatA domain-containing protein n=1 Tax=Pedobacter sp. MC2016-24 TaxID=2780090 RepID=UPI00187E2FCA|nr:BatA domain-containing protein [Pedobacter sp. MC2016-24]MBE9602033.1 BatA domain-containing protein [Pedobacter sp. MC2016-24]
MNFLYPGFLFALLAIAIPIAIHLFNFRKFKKVYFSNVQFLKEAKEQNSSREKLKHVLVLISRILAIVFLVLAFAQPYLQQGGEQKAGLSNLIRVYIDNSYSMGMLNKEGTLLDEAKRKAKEIAAAYPITDQFKLLTNDFEGKHQRLVNKEEFIQLLDEVKISANSPDLQQVVNRLQSDLSANRNEKAYILSDFQQNFVGDKPVQTDKQVAYSYVRLKANSIPNVSVDSVWSLSPVHRPGQPEQFVVQLRNYGETDAADIPLKLTVNGQQKAVANVKIPAGKAVRDTLSFSGLTAGWQEGVLRIKDFPLTFDDALNFSFKVDPELKVLSVTGNASGRFVRSLFAADAYFKLSEMPESNIRYTEFSNYSLIVLTGLTNPASGLAQQLKAYVEAGGSVVVFPDLEAGANVYSPFLKTLSLPAVKELVSGPAIASSMDLKSPFFKDAFEDIPKNIDLPQVSRYFSYAEQRSDHKENVLSLPLNRFLIAQYHVGAGRIYLSSSDLNEKNGNLARHPVFVPLMFNFAFSSKQEQPLYYTVGKSTLLESDQIRLMANQHLKLVSEQFEVIPEVRQTPGKTLLYVADQVRKSGFYELKNGNDLIAVVAFNDNRAESDLRYATEKELKTTDINALNLQLKNSGSELWKLCLILAIIFIAIEILLIRFFNNPKNRTTT